MESTEPKILANQADNAPELPVEVLGTLTQIGEEVNASLNLDEVLAHTAVLIKRHIDYELFGVLLVDADGLYLQHRFAIGYPAGTGREFARAHRAGNYRDGCGDWPSRPRQRCFRRSPLH